jgi:hypothetical protein
MIELSRGLYLTEEYRHEFYDTLPDFFIAKDKLRRRYDVIERLGGVICAHGLHEVLGICLLHKHFNIEESEQLGKRALREQNEALIAPQPVRDGAHAYFWRLYSYNNRSIYVPTEVFADDDELVRKLPTMAKISKEYPQFFVDFAKISEELNTLHFFGLAILHPDFVRLADGETRLESTDSAKRVLRVRAELLERLNMFDVTETLWTFTPSALPAIESLATPRRPEPPKPPEPSDDRCKGHCTGHCVNHCKYHCKSHCRSHCENNHG